jgi:hypothetical protein
MKDGEDLTKDGTEVSKGTNYYYADPSAPGGRRDVRVFEVPTLKGDLFCVGQELAPGTAKNEWKGVRIEKHGRHHKVTTSDGKLFHILVMKGD